MQPTTVISSRRLRNVSAQIEVATMRWLAEIAEEARASAPTRIDWRTWSRAKNQNTRRTAS